MTHFLRKQKFILLFLELCLISTSGNTQEISDFFITHYSKKNHNIAKNCYDIVQANSSKMIFTASAYGFSYFNGHNWKTNIVDKSRKPRYFQRLVQDKNTTNKYYVGGRNQCGYFIIQGDSLTYKRLINTVENKKRLGGKLQDIFLIDGKVHYLGISTGGIVFDPVSNQKKNINPVEKLNGRVIYFRNGQNIFLKRQNKDVYLLKNNEWILQQNTIYKKYDIQYYAKLSRNLSLIIGKGGKFFLRKDEGYFREVKSISTLLKKEHHFVAKLKGKYIYIMTNNLLISYNLKANKFRLLKNFRKLELRNFTFDDQANLWISSDDGVIFVELNTNLNITKNEEGVYKRINIKNIQFDVLRGQRKVKASSSGKISKMISNIGFIYNITLLNGRYFICTNTGIYELYEYSFEYKLLVKGDFQNLVLSKTLESRQNYYAIGSYGLKVFDNKLILLSESSFGSNKKIYSSILYKDHIFYSTKTTLFRVKLDKQRKKITTIQKVKFNSKTRFDYNLQILNGKLLIVNALGLFVYNPKKNMAEDITYLIDGLKKNRRGHYDRFFSHFLQITHDTYLTSPVTLRGSQKGRFEKFAVMLRKKGVQHFDILPYGLRRIGDAYITFLNKKNDGIIELIGQDKIVEFDSFIKRDFNFNFHSFIREITVKKEISDSTRNSIGYNFIYTPIYVGFNKQTSIQRLSYKTNTLIFTFACDSYAAQDRNHYSYQLIGIDNTWSNWSKEQKKEYTHLREGTYTFKVRCKNVYGTISSADSYTFTILPPWYRTWWAYLLYGLGGTAWLLGSGYGYSRYRSRRLHRHNQELEQVVAIRTQEISTQKDAISHQAQELKITNEKILLQKEEITQQAEELQITNEAISQQAQMLRASNEKLWQINEITKKEKEAKVGLYAQQAADALIKIEQVRELLERDVETAKRMLNVEVNTAGEFAIVQAKVRENYPAFVETLDQALTDGKISQLHWQVGYCLKLNMPPKEVAKILPITNRSVSVYGSQLRKLNILDPFKK